MKALATLALAGLLALGCTETPPDEGSEPTPSCLTAMQAAANEPDPSAADPLIEETLDACGTTPQWIAALEMHPAAMGYRSADVIDELTVQSACYESDTAVCRDARSRGIID